MKIETTTYYCDNCKKEMNLDESVALDFKYSLGKSYTFSDNNYLPSKHICLKGRINIIK